jgi:hypothetical protein
MYGGQENWIEGLSREREGKRQRGKNRRRWKDNIKICLQEVGWKGVDCTDLA